MDETSRKVADKSSSAMRICEEWQSSVPTVSFLTGESDVAPQALTDYNLKH